MGNDTLAALSRQILETVESGKTGCHVTITSAEAGMITHELPEGWMPSFQRAEGPTYTARLQRLMTEGRWLQDTQIDVGVLNGQMMMLNGQHRLIAQRAAGIDIQWYIRLYLLESLSEARELYTRLDADGRYRNNVAVAHAHPAMTPLYALSPRFAAACLGAGGTIMSRLAVDGSRIKSIAHVVEYLDEVWLDTMVALWNVVKEAEGASLKRYFHQAAIIAPLAFLMKLEKGPEFIEAVCRNDHRGWAGGFADFATDPDFKKRHKGKYSVFAEAMLIRAYQGFIEGTEPSARFTACVGARSKIGVGPWQVPATSS